MLKIAVFDTGYGGELFADRLEEKLPVVEVIRIIAWRDAKAIAERPLAARKLVEKSLRSYIGNVDLLVIANYQISATYLSYLRRKYKNQKFVGFTLKPKRIAKRPTIILTTKPTTRSFNYLSLTSRLKTKTLCLDDWPALIDDGELSDEQFQSDLAPAVAYANNQHFCKRRSDLQVLLACGQFSDCIPEFRKAFGHNTRIVDSFDHTLAEVSRTLKLGYQKQT